MSEILSLLKKLIEFKTLSSKPEEISKCASFIIGYLEKIGIQYSHIEQKSIPSIIVTPEKGYAPILLMAHFDVVKGDDSLFTPVEKNGKLYGRGSIDDKYAVALSLVLLKKWMKILKKNKLDQESLPFGILLTGDEETGGFNGAKYALEQVKASFAIALDGGSPEKIIIKEKGILQLKLEASGKAAHGARPWLGINAIDILIDDIAKLRDLFQNNDNNPEHWHKTVNLGAIKGGESINQVPDSAHALLDIRYTENDDPDNIIAMIDEITVSTVSVKAKEPLFISDDSDYLTTLLSLLPGTKTGCEHGASDARFLQLHSIPGIIWGAQGNMTHHGAHEHVDIESINFIFDILDKFFTKIHKEINTL